MKGKQKLNIALVGNQAGAYGYDLHDRGTYNNIISSLCVSYIVKGKLPNNFVSSAFEPYETKFVLDKIEYTATLWDSVYLQGDPTSEPHDPRGHLRQLLYRNRDIFLIVFSVASRITFYGVKNWVSEIKNCIPNAKFILVGAEVELRDDSKQYLSEMDYNFENNLEKELVTYEEGVKLCIELGGWCYMECSARTRVGTQALLEEVIRAHSSKHLTQKLNILSMIKKYNPKYFPRFLQKKYALFDPVPSNNNVAINIGLLGEYKSAYTHDNKSLVRYFLMSFVKVLDSTNTYNNNIKIEHLNTRYNLAMPLENQLTHIDVHDQVTGNQEYGRIIKLNYTSPPKDISFIIFSVAKRDTFNNVKRWVSELRSYVPKSKFILVGTEMELRKNQKKYLSELNNKKIPEKGSVSYHEGTKLCLELGAWCYMECSIRTKEGMQALFDEAIIAARSKHLIQHMSFIAMIKKYNPRYLEQHLVEIEKLTTSNLNLVKDSALMKILRDLLEDPDAVNLQDQEGYTLFMRSISRKEREIDNLLLETLSKNTSINLMLQTKTGKTTLSLVIQHGNKYQLIKKIIRRLQSQKEGPLTIDNDTRDKTGNSIAHIAVFDGDIKTLNIISPTLCNTVNHYNETPLHFIKKWYAHELKSLHSNNYSENLKKLYNIKGRISDLLDVLINKKGINPWVTDRYGISGYQVTYNIIKDVLLMIKNIEKLTSKPKEKPYHRRESEKTLLSRHAKKGYRWSFGIHRLTMLENMRLLPCFVSDRYNLKTLPIHSMADVEDINPSLFPALEVYFENHKSDINVRNRKEKLTPLMITLNKSDNPKVIDCLLKNGADLYCVDPIQFKTAIDMANTNKRWHSLAVLLRHRKPITSDVVEAFLSDCAYLIEMDNMNSKQKIIDNYISHLVHIDFTAFKSDETQWTKLFAHFKNLKGNVTSDTLAVNLEGWHTKSFLTCLSYIMFRVLVNFKRSEYKLTNSSRLRKENAYHLIRGELVLILETLRTTRNDSIVNKLNGRDDISATIKKEIASAHIESICTIIGSLDDKEEFCYHTGYERHAIYVVFLRQNNNVVIRIDNLGAGSSRHNSTKDSPLVKPHLIGQIPIKSFQDKTSSIMSYLKNIFEANFLPKEEALSRIYTTQFDPDKSSDVVKSWPALPTQKVGNCVVYNYKIRLLMQLGESLSQWLAVQVIKLASINGKSESTTSLFHKQLQPPSSKRSRNRRHDNDDSDDHQSSGDELTSPIRLGSD